MELIKPPSKLRAGTEIVRIRNQFEMLSMEYYSGDQRFHLDLSDVVFMDSCGFRLVFNFLPIFNKVTLPKDPHITELYNTWLDSKKGLVK